MPALSSLIATEPPEEATVACGSAPAVLHHSATPAIRELRPSLHQMEEAFGQPFSIIDTESGETVYAAGGSLPVDIDQRLALLDEVARRARPEIVEDEAPLCLLAIPLAGVVDYAQLVAVATFVTMPVAEEADIASAARVLGVDAGRALRWASDRRPHCPQILLRLAEATHERLAQRRTIARLSAEASEAVAHARDTYVELDLLHCMMRRLHVADSEAELWQETLRSLGEAIPAEALALVAASDGEPVDVMVHGHNPLTDGKLIELIRDLQPRKGHHALALNRRETSLATWRTPVVRELASVPVVNGDTIMAWLVAINHRGSADGLGEFGTVEVQLLESIASILSIHASNSRLFRSQAELFGSSVHALTSAIDAKDRYTSGHSDRVARLSVRLAEHMGMSQREINTLYVGGLLHDIGKIGIDDQVLNKPGRLTSDEFEHIKLHPQFGCQILKGISQLEKVLPIVMHHHEAWNGGGYPHNLKGSDTPLAARIVAVADAFDAMTSDRPYRPGMPLHKVDEIFLDGAGSQWDPDIIDAFFAVRDDFMQCVEGSAGTCSDLPLDPAAWIA